MVLCHCLLRCRSIGFAIADIYADVKGWPGRVLAFATDTLAGNCHSFCSFGEERKDRLEQT